MEHQMEFPRLEKYYAMARVKKLIMVSFLLGMFVGAVIPALVYALS